MALICVGCFFFVVDVRGSRTLDRAVLAAPKIAPKYVLGAARGDLRGGLVYVLYDPDNRGSVLGGLF